MEQEHVKSFIEKVIKSDPTADDAFRQLIRQKTIDFVRGVQTPPQEPVVNEPQSDLPA